MTLGWRVRSGCRAVAATAALCALTVPAFAQAQTRLRSPRAEAPIDLPDRVRAPRGVLPGEGPMRPRMPRPDNDRDGERPPAHLTRPLPEIVADVQATPPYDGMDYIGVAGFETRRMVYVLRFLDGRQVVVVHVDARSGRIMRRVP